MERKTHPTGSGTTIQKDGRALVHTIGKTEYLIRSEFSDKSKEEFKDRLLKIILKDVRPEEKKMRNHLSE